MVAEEEKMLLIPVSKGSHSVIKKMINARLFSAT